MKTHQQKFIDPNQSFFNFDEDNNIPEYLKNNIRERIKFKKTKKIELTKDEKLEEFFMNLEEDHEELRDMYNPKKNS